MIKCPYCEKEMKQNATGFYCTCGGLEKDDNLPKRFL